MRLDVGVLGAEQFRRPPDGDAFRGVGLLAASVVAGAGVSLGVLVGEGEPRAARTAGEVKFSAAMSWRVLDCRPASASRMPPISGSWRRRAPKSCGRAVAASGRGFGGAAARAAGVVTGIGGSGPGEGCVASDPM